MFKDLKSGQTHYYGDNCGDPEHNRKSIRKGTMKVDIKSRKGDGTQLIMTAILPTELVHVIISYLIEHRL